MTCNGWYAMKPNWTNSKLYEINGYATSSPLKKFSKSLETSIKPFSSNDDLRLKLIENNKKNKQHRSNILICLITFVHSFIYTYIYTHTHDYINFKFLDLSAFLISLGNLFL